MDTVTPKDEEYTYEGRVLISQVDADGKITFVNRQFCKVSGYKPEEVIGKSHSILRHPDMPDAIFDQMYKTITSGQAWNGVLKNLRKDGAYFWVEEEILPIKDGDKIIGYIATAKAPTRQNIEEHKELHSKMAEGN